MSPQIEDEDAESQDTPAGELLSEAEVPVSVGAQLAGGHDLAPSTVTLSGMLNAIDGVSSQEGCVLIAST